MTSCVSTPRLRSAWYICSLPTEGTLKSFSPTRNSVGVLIRSAWKNGYEILIHRSCDFHGGPISVSYCVMYWSTPYIESCSALPAPLVAALKRGSVATVVLVEIP